MPRCVLCKTEYKKHSHECTPGCSAYEIYKNIDRNEELGIEINHNLFQRLSDGFWMLSDEMSGNA